MGSSGFLSSSEAPAKVVPANSKSMEAILKIFILFSLMEGEFRFSIDGE
jgi:hypothetical protein